MAVLPRVGFQPRTTPAERRAFYDLQRQLARQRRLLEQAIAASAAGVGDSLTEDPADSSLYLYSGTLTEDPVASGLHYTTPETMIEDPEDTHLYRLE